MWEPSQTYDVRHDRAALHFLDRSERLEPPMPSGFQGPCAPVVTSLLEHLHQTGLERCSGLPRSFAMTR